ncbi:calcium-independent phospholipase A2-gamma-like isoform X2 [Pygocentrus nattereri]|uniref:calcium-independent phospholipase A2-gamma-like isoform X2 n=1 Tax=Pygocentrus nattereri TaxID=42514 RepID=UPI0018918469|nr:calcium-independent phospholipase A2-gamma-like isoform X2 [Pygocentrus nattereri]
MKPYWSNMSSCLSPCNSAWTISLKRSKLRPLSCTNISLKHGAYLCYAKASRIYSTSSRETFKVEAPIGVYQDSKAAFKIQLLRMRLGSSFKRLSRHINVHFKQKEMDASVFSGQARFVSAVQEPVSRVHKQAQCQRALRDRAYIVREPREETLMNQSEESPLFSAYPSLQLFHISSLATRFGESYSYVASHINSVFSKNPVKQACEVLPASEDIMRTTRKRKVTKHQSTISKQNTLLETGSTLFNANQAAAEEGNNPDLSCSWEEGYFHFARHINQYFGAKMTDAVEESQHSQSAYSAKHEQSCAASQGSSPSESTQNSLPLRPKSLFHISNLTTCFGENYAYMSTHINHYFKGSAATEEEVERDPYRGQPEYSVALERKPLSFFQCLLNPSAIPSTVGSYLGMASNSPASASTAPLDRVVSPTPADSRALGRRLAEEKSRVLLGRLKKAKTRSSISSCVEELNAHLILHPACKAVVWQEKVLLQMLKHRQIFWMDEKLQGAIRETLALIGYVDPLKGCGIRVLSIDGGGTRGIVPLQVLKQLEAETGQRVYQLFDYICGVSTGAVLAFTLALARTSLEECEEMYRRFGSDVFRQNPLVGTVKMGWTHSYYNTETWEMILKEKIGDRLLIRTARDELSPKVSAVSAVVNWGTSPKPFIFRNYNHSPGRLSRYAGGSGYQLWQAVRASSAAPGYFQEFPLHNDIHQDGGLILNNPCALAVHESRLLWPNQPFQCVLSLGTGRYDNARRGPATSTSLRAKISNLISSATDTEGVHTLLDDLLEPNVYFRFNPMLSAEVSLDESRPGALQQLQEDTQHYLERNRPKLVQLGKVLGEERTALGKTWNWISEKGWKLQQRWG